ncbi:MAG: AMIN domain-containing protein, partial [Psychrobacter sp.]|nr:AMIN domain-containing protein [Psychrobacter sp.]
MISHTNVRNDKTKKMTSQLATRFALPALTISMIAISSSAYAEQSIKSVAAVQLDPATTQLRVGFDGSPVTPEAYQLDNPARLVLDFNQVKSALPERFKEYNVGLINDVTALSSDSTTRLIVGLKNDGQYTTSVKGNDLLLTMVDPIAAVRSAPDSTSIIAPVITPIEEASSNSNQARSAQAPVVQAKSAPAETMVVRVNPLLNPALATSPVASQYSYDGLSALNYSGAGEGGNISIALANEAIPVD